MADVQTFDPFRSFKFTVQIAGMGATQVGFQKVSGLKETTDVVEYREGNMPVHKRKLPGLTNYDPITLTRGATNSSYLFDWRALTARYNSNGGLGDGVPPAGDIQAENATSGFRRSVTIKLYDKGEPNNVAVRSWKLHLAWPSELSVSDLNAEGSEVLVETLVLQHEGLNILTPPERTFTPTGTSEPEFI